MKIRTIVWILTRMLATSGLAFVSACSQGPGETSPSGGAKCDGNAIYLLAEDYVHVQEGLFRFDPSQLTTSLVAACPLPYPINGMAVARDGTPWLLSAAGAVFRMDLSA